MALEYENSYYQLLHTDEVIIEDFESMSRNARETQVELLRKILERNANVEYLQRLGLNCRTDEASFKACIPVITYSDIETDVDRVVAGETTPILCVDPATSFSLSSGTTGGKCKLIPRPDCLLAQAMKAGQIGSAYRKRAFPRKGEGRPVVTMFLYAGRQFETKSGLKAGTGSTNFYRSEAFKNVKSRPYDMTSPISVILGCSVPQQMYCHLLCGLYRCQEVDQMSALFAYMIVEPFRLLERVWRDICKDIREGTVNECVSDPELRSSVLEVLSPNPELADFIQRECAKGWSGIIERLFPNLLYIMCIFSGSMLPYVAPMRQYAGRVPLMNYDYSSSEAWLGINLDPRCPAEDAPFTIIPSFAYFEFIPVNRDTADYDYVEGDEIVGLTDVKLGQEYEVVLTTPGGLYRYRLGDIVKVTGFFNSTPKVSFVCRRGVLLSVNTDKTDEEELRLVVEKASQILKKSNMELADYSSYTDVDSKPGHYVIFWELRSHKHIDMEILNECCKVLDQSFNNAYMRGRADHTIGPLELVIVREGAFSGLMDKHVEKNGVGASQYKTPRCFKNSATLKHFRDETIATVRSPEFPPKLLAAWRPSEKIVG